FKTTDAGGSWKALPRVPAITTAIVIDPLTPSTIYAPTDMGIFKSTDGGENWSAMATGLPGNAPVTAPAIAPTDSSTIYLGYRDRFDWSPGVIKTTNGGESWNRLVVDIPARSAIR